MRLAALTLLAAAGVGLSVDGGKGAPPAAAPAHPVAVELFTSQGCSSCPSADAVLVRLDSDPNVVAISRPVTYWDRLGWKDTLARLSNTALQRAYTRREIPGAGNYTPQSVIQGRVGLVGGNEIKVRKAIADALRLPEPGLSIANAPGGGRVVALSGKAEREALVSVVALRRRAIVEIRTGENGGRTLRYANVVLDERVVGRWKGGAARVAIPAAALEVGHADRYALLVREGATGPILAARFL